MKRFMSIQDPKLVWRLARGLVIALTALYSGVSMLVQSANGAEPDTNGPVITIATEHTALLLSVGRDQRLYQSGFGARGINASKEGTPARELEFYPPGGDGFILEPALQAIHSDGNTSTDLRFVGVTTTSEEPNIQLTRIDLKDGFYPFSVSLLFKAYQAEDVIEQWAEITHEENRPVTLYRFASSGLLAPKAAHYWLTHFHGDWAQEAQWLEEPLTSGIKVLDSKIGVRADQFRTPSFLVALDEPAKEESGTVIGGSLEWSGSFQFALEVDMKNRLRALAGINPFNSQVQSCCRSQILDSADAVDLERSWERTGQPELSPLGAALWIARRRKATTGAAEQLGSHRIQFR